MSTSIDRLPVSGRAALAAEVMRLKHDLGKYVAMHQRWLSPEAPAVERHEALTQDLLQTRRSPMGTRDARSVWLEFRPVLVGEADLPGGFRVDLSDDPDLQAVEQAMAVVGEVIDALRANRGSVGLVERGIEAAFAVSEGCRALERRIRRQCLNEGEGEAK